MNILKKIIGNYHNNKIHNINKWQLCKTNGVGKQTGYLNW